MIKPLSWFCNQFLPIRHTMYYKCTVPVVSSPVTNLLLNKFIWLPITWDKNFGYKTHKLRLISGLWQWLHEISITLNNCNNLLLVLACMHDHTCIDYCWLPSFLNVSHLNLYNALPSYILFIVGDLNLSILRHCLVHLRRIMVLTLMTMIIWWDSNVDVAVSFAGTWNVQAVSTFTCVFVAAIFVYYMHF